MAIKMATWLHGNGAVPQFPPSSPRNVGGSARFQGADRSTNFFHFPITTPVIIDTHRPKVTKIFVLHTARFCRITKIERRSGVQRAWGFNPIQEPGDIPQQAEVVNSNFILDKSMFNVAPLNNPNKIDQRLGVTVMV